MSCHACRAEDIKVLTGLGAFVGVLVQLNISDRLGARRWVREASSTVTQARSACSLPSPADALLPNAPEVQGPRRTREEPPTKESDTRVGGCYPACLNRDTQ